MTTLTEYHAQLCMAVAMCGVCGGILGMMARLGSHASATIGCIAGLVAGVGIVVSPAYVDTGASGYEEVDRLRDRDHRLADDVGRALSDGMLSRYEHRRIVYMANDLQDEDARRGTVAIKRGIIAQEAAALRDSGKGCNENSPVSTDTEGKIG